MMLEVEQVILRCTGGNFDIKCRIRLTVDTEINLRSCVHEIKTLAFKYVVAFHHELIGHTIIYKSRNIHCAKTLDDESEYWISAINFVILKLCRVVVGILLT